MEKIKAAIFDDRITSMGFLFIMLSFVAFALGVTLSTSPPEGLFFLNYSLSAGYLIVVLLNIVIKHRWRVLKANAQHWVVLLVLWFISAFSLNREFNVFDASVPWLSVYLVLAVISLLLSLFIAYFNRAGRLLLCFFLGAAFVLFCYYAIYLLPLYGISVIGIIAIGISLHTFVPLLLAIITMRVFLRATHKNTWERGLFFAGILLPLLFCALFLWQWNSLNNKIHLVTNQHTLSGSKLPAWVAVSQQMEPSPIAEKMMKAGLVYTAFDLRGNWFWAGMPSHSFTEPKQHDPLVAMATFFFGLPTIDETDRIKILEAMYDSRYQAMDRLWSGEALKTGSVISNVKLFPEYRMAYTEKTITVRNSSMQQWSTQEAIYTFHMPEGSVVTSLSLWIDGKEAKARLSTSAKADSAYRQIVGVENHDPSVVHWQEGNTVSVRVYPCTITEDRKVKIGFTSPLQKDGDRLIYQNIYFDGPPATNALESVQLSFSQQPEQLKLPGFGNETINQAGIYRNDHAYQPYWELSFKAPQLATAAFTFDGAAYQVKSYQPALTSFSPKTIYLDLNRAWAKEEFDALWDKIKTMPVYVYADKLTALTAQNKDAVFEQMHQLNFSIFPVYKISEPDSSLLITKSTATAPNFKDLQESEFADGLSAYLKQPKSIRMYNMGSELSPYLKTLKELRVFNYDEGDVSRLYNLLSKHQFVQHAENDSTVVINTAQMELQRLPAQKLSTNAPDHLLRLFAYNDIMRQAGPNYFSKNYVQPALIAEAQQAYVVSPVSSLLVLETEADYKRFGIDADANSLKNASMKSAGSVPEPKDWMLVALVLAVVVSLTYKRKAANANCL